jgi:hypothetical protein
VRTYVTESECVLANVEEIDAITSDLAISRFDLSGPETESGRRLTRKKLRSDGLF